MNNQENLSVLIKLRGEGMELIDQLIGDMGKAGAKTGEFRQKADELNGELQRLEQQQGLIESFRKSKERVDEAAVAYAAAQQRAQQLGREMAQLENPTRQQQAAFAKARNEVNQAGGRVLLHRLFHVGQVGAGQHMHHRAQALHSRTRQLHKVGLQRHEVVAGVLVGAHANPRSVSSVIWRAGKLYPTSQPPACGSALSGSPATPPHGQASVALPWLMCSSSCLACS